MQSRTAEVTPRAAVDRVTLGVVAALLALTAVGHLRTPLLPTMGADLRVGVTELGLLTAGFALGRIAVNIPAGRLADRSPVTGVVVATVTMVVGTGVVVWLDAFALVLAAAVLTGVSSGTMNTTAMTTATRRAPRARRGAAMAAYSTGLMTGQMLGPAAAGLAASVLTWRAVHGAGAFVAGLAGTATVVILVRLLRADAGHLSTAPGAAPGRGAAAARASDDDLGAAELAGISAVAFAVFFSLGALAYTLLAVMAAEELGMSVQAVGVGLGAAGLARVVGANVAGLVADRVSRRAAIVPGLAIMSLASFALVLPLTVPGWFVVSVVLSLASAGAAVAGAVIGDRSAPALVGRRMGVFRTTGDVGLLAGPAVGALVHDHLGRPASALLVGAVVGVVALWSRRSIQT